MGALAADVLVERLTHGWRPVEQRTLEARLVLRRSIGPPPLEARVASAGRAGTAKN